MELTRATITGHPFPQATDGYDRAAVDSHLEAIAEAVEQSAEPVGQDAAEQMRSIVEGAEQSAKALRETVQREADELRDAARNEADAIRSKAVREASAQVAAAGTAVKSLLERVDAIGLGVDDSRHHVMQAAEAMAQRLSEDSEPLVATLRERAEALGAELDLIGSGLAGGLVEAIDEREHTSPRDPAPGTGLAEGDLEDAAEELEVREPTPRPEPDQPSEPATPGTERARLVALNLAVGGTPRDETERHLREELGVEDAGTILDEAYARAERT